MTPSQLYLACRTLAPNFRVCIEFTTMPTLTRVMAWHGRRPRDMEEQGAAIPFPENTEFEPKFAALLQQALAVLQQP